MAPSRPYTRHPCGIYGPRHLVRRHARRVKRRLLAEANGTVASEPPIPPPGHEQLFSFWAPALEAGEYTATVQQEIDSPAWGGSLQIPESGTTTATQMFDVVAPRFSLPDSAINSSFPPQGYGALANTLPHVVLSDPHLPWARTASAKPGPGDPDYSRNMVPWLALLVFTQDELKLPADQLNTLFAGTSLGTAARQTQTFAIRIPVADIAKIKSTISPISALQAEPSDDKNTDVILVPSALFSELFTQYDTDGAPVAQAGPDVSRYKYLAHVRDVNTAGMAESCVEENAIFGIILSHRVGPLSNTQPQPVVAHLVSIEGVESAFMNGHWPIDPAAVPYVAMSSIHSWNFITLPAGSFNIESTFVDLGTSPNGLGLLRAPDATIKSVDASTPMGARLKGRLQDGYTMTKYRTATGEETAAIYRGPLTPTRVQYPLLPTQQAQAGAAWQSNSGIDLQIMDPEVGIMDITYSVAWQLGRTLAVADKNFTAALGRLRTAIYSGAMNKSKVEILRRRAAYQTRQEAVTSLTRSLPVLNAQHKTVPGLHAPGGSMADRWRRPRPEGPDLSYRGQLVQDVFSGHAAAMGRSLMLSPDGDGTQRYDETNTASSVDWMIVLSWVLDRMFLHSVPAHYLVIDPSYLPQESLRFFHVDRNWTDALVDGALSLGNHLDGVDKVRTAIHDMIYAYLHPDPPVKPLPQVPTYGFLMHSEAVTKYPDLKVTVELAGVEEAAPILRHENLDIAKGVMLCLLDQQPGDPGLKSVTFTEPPHQQSFIAGGELDAGHIKTLYKRIFTAKGQAPDPTPWAVYQWTRPDPSGLGAPAQALAVETAGQGGAGDNDVKHPKSVFKWGVQKDPEVRTLLPTPWAFDVNTVLNEFGKDGNKYVDDIPNSAMAGVQLDNPIYRLKIAIPTPAGEQEVSGESGGGGSPPKQVVRAFPPVLESATVTPVPFKQQLELRHRAPEASSGKTPPAKLDQHRPQVGNGFVPGPGHGHPGTPPPHYRPVPPIETRPEPPPGEAPPGTGPRAPPTYDYKVLPADNDPDNPGIPYGTGVAKDLVFSVVQQPYSGSSAFHLTELQIRLQLATGGPSDPSCLLDGYRGPGPFMASNVRFVVLAQIVPPTETDPARYLALRLLPRSSRGWALPDMCSEMTFVLPVCMVRAGLRTPIPITTIEMYDGYKPVPQLNYWAISLAKPQG